ncbi:hypothetical protein GGF31_001086 [Allomyces arbusculus]|nr:hypothetical protein GGF31_001086 [Allomyces arbusculus]
MEANSAQVAMPPPATLVGNGVEAPFSHAAAMVAASAASHPETTTTTPAAMSASMSAFPSSITPTPLLSFPPATAPATTAAPPTQFPLHVLPPQGPAPTALMWPPQQLSATADAGVTPAAAGGAFGYAPAPYNPAFASMYAGMPATNLPAGLLPPGYASYGTPPPYAASGYPYLGAFGYAFPGYSMPGVAADAAADPLVGAPGTKPGTRRSPTKKRLSPSTASVPTTTTAPPLATPALKSVLAATANASNVSESDNDSVVSAEPPQKKARKQFTQSEKNWLEAKFATTQHPTQQQARDWCAEIGTITPEQLLPWFKRRRERRNQILPNTVAATAPPPAPVPVAAPAARKGDYLSSLADAKGAFVDVQTLRSKAFYDWLVADKGERSEQEKITLAAMLRRSRRAIQTEFIVLRNSIKLVASWLTRAVKQSNLTVLGAWISALTALPVQAHHINDQAEEFRLLSRVLSHVGNSATDKDIQEGAQKLREKWRAVVLSDSAPAPAAPSTAGSAAPPSATKTRPVLNKDRITKPTPAALAAAPAAAAMPPKSSSPLGFLADAAVAKPNGTSTKFVAKPARITTAAPTLVTAASAGPVSATPDGPKSPEKPMSPPSVSTVTNDDPLAVRGIKRKIVVRGGKDGSGAAGTSSPASGSTGGILRKPGQPARRVGRIKWLDNDGGDLCEIREFSASDFARADANVAAAASMDWEMAEPGDYADDDMDMNPEPTHKAIKDARALERAEGRTAFGREKHEPKIAWREPAPCQVASAGEPRGANSQEIEQVDPSMAVEYLTELLIPPTPASPTRTAYFPPEIERPPRPLSQLDFSTVKNPQIRAFMDPNAVTMPQPPPQPQAPLLGGANMDALHQLLGSFSALAPPAGQPPMNLHALFGQFSGAPTAPVPTPAPMLGQDQQAAHLLRMLQGQMQILPASITPTHTPAVPPASLALPASATMAAGGRGTPEPDAGKRFHPYAAVAGGKKKNKGKKKKNKAAASS